MEVKINKHVHTATMPPSSDEEDITYFREFETYLRKERIKASQYQDVICDKCRCYKKHGKAYKHLTHVSCFCGHDICCTQGFFNVIQVGDIHKINSPWSMEQRTHDEEISDLQIAINYYRCFKAGLHANIYNSIADFEESFKLKDALKQEELYPNKRLLFNSQFKKKSRLNICNLDVMVMSSKPLKVESIKHEAPKTFSPNIKRNYKKEQMERLIGRILLPFNREIMKQYIFRQIANDVLPFKSIE